MRFYNFSETVTYSLLRTHVMRTYMIRTFSSQQTYSIYKHVRQFETLTSYLPLVIVHANAIYKTSLSRGIARETDDTTTAE